MSENLDIPQNATEVVPTSDTTPLTPRQAADSLSQYRYKRDASGERAAEEMTPSQVNDAAREIDAAPPEEATGELPTEATDQAEAPPLDLPRSWAKDKAEAWARLDRDTQEYLLDHDSKASAEVRRTHNEAAERARVLETERAQLEQARKQYEEASLVALQELQGQQLGEFADIRTHADVERLAREDWPRYALWDAKQKQIAGRQQELRAAQDRQQQEYQAQYAKFVKDNTDQFIETVPELKNSEKATKFATDAVNLYRDLGYSEDEITQLQRGTASISPHDRRQLQMTREALLYRQAKAAIPKAVAKPIPQVQRPGVAAPRNADKSSIEVALSKRLDTTGNWKDAAELLIARRSR